MKFSEQWLREWVNPSITTGQLAEQLTMAGLEVEAVTPVAPDFEGVVVGEVLSIEPHPQADNLQLCQVNVGEEKPLSIVCGASNVRVGMRVPAAVAGAILPEGFKIKKAKLRGVESFGMLCSAKELGLAESANGLMVLEQDAKPGIKLQDYLRLEDYSIELGLTPNRSDCLSIAGIAREVGVANRCEVNEPVINENVPAIIDSLDINISAGNACPRYLGRVIKEINTNAMTPMWMQETLRRSGVRCISPVVDVTNYVMLELGQPMHAFDLNKLEGGIHVRLSKENETIILLDEQKIGLKAGTLVIADHKKAVALAGIMGGLDTAVTEITDNLFLESAFFAPQIIAGKARTYGLHTDSSHRFERGVDPECARKAMERATALLLNIVGGQAGPIIEVVDESSLPEHKTITLRKQRIKRLLGFDIADDEITDILLRLGLNVTVQQDGSSWQIVSPSFRFDIAIEADLIEELVRCHGYDQLPDSRPMGQLRIEGEPENTINLNKLRQVLVDRDYQEAITYSFIDPAMQRLLDPGHEAVELANPISADMAVMRTSLWPGLIQALKYNQNRQQKRIRLFECGVRFIKEDNDNKEEKIISGVVVGGVWPEQWGAQDRDIDFFDIKADIEAMLALTGNASRFTFMPKQHPALHPGQSAAIQYNNEIVGWLGVLNPIIIKKLALDGNVVVFELDYDAIAQARLPQFEELSRFPTVRRDIAIIVEENVSSSKIEECIADVAGALLQNLQLFDVYQGKSIDSGRKSLALGLTLQEKSRTLTDQEIDALIDRLLKELNNNFGATLRE